MILDDWLRTDKAVYLHLVWSSEHHNGMLDTFL